MDRTAESNIWDDEFVQCHFRGWLDWHVPEDERESVAAGIKRMLAEDPELFRNGDRAWSELRFLAESQGFIANNNN